MAEITVTKLTDVDLCRLACAFTSGKDSSMTLEKIYRCEHSPIRTQLFWIEMRGIPTFVSVHFVRHKIGVEHFVKSHRDDRGGTGTEDRNTPVDHAMLINAQALINMARKRLCRKAHAETQSVMRQIAFSIHSTDPDLFAYLEPDCFYRNGCHELKSCGLWESINKNTIKTQ